MTLERRWIAWDGESPFPKKSFATEAQAWAEAERLAGENRGAWFSVLPVVPGLHPATLPGRADV